MSKSSVRDLHLKRKKMWDASMLNHKKYLNKNGDGFDKKYLEKRACPACGARDERVLFMKSGGTYVRCNNCTMIYLNPVFKDKYISEYYQNNHTVQSETVEADLKFYGNLYNRGLDTIGKYSKKENKNMRILDIGCSSGVFLDFAKKRGFETFGVQLNKKEALIASSKGHHVFQKQLAEIDFEKKFDVVTMWDVFEHVKNGIEMFKNIRSLLNKDGLIFLQIPSGDSLAARILQEKCNMFDGLEHVNIYTKKAIGIFFNKTVIKILALDSVISEIGVINNYLDYYDPYLGGANNKLLGLLNEKEVYDKNIAYKYQVLCKPFIR